jgi:N6-adenosine-specific RNA methylase IME4
MDVADPREARRKEWPAMAEGKFRLIYADPPWQYDFSQSERRDIDFHQYELKTAEEIAELKVPAADDCILFLWGTSPKLTEALLVLKS